MFQSKKWIYDITITIVFSLFLSSVALWIASLAYPLDVFSFRNRNFLVYISMLFAVTPLIILCLLTYKPINMEY